MIDYWSWAFSDLVSNTDRGTLAEYIVAMAVGAAAPVRNSWASYDIEGLNGEKIEVKSSAYVQAWHQEKPSTIQFGIRKTREWLPETNSFGSEKKRHSEVYVFCLLAEQQKERINPLDLSQWEFYVLPTQLIDRLFGDKGTLSLNQVRQHATKLAVDEIGNAVRRALPYTNSMQL
tara:strand:+ start:258 stop:782 length:525 start_codon:yes stop_codon:yes gene_type:complete